MKIPVVFFGTDTFASTILEGLIKSPFLDIRLIITQPDRPIGRQQEIEKQIVKTIGEAHGIAVEQPASLKNYQLASEYDLGIVAHYGSIIPKAVLTAPKFGLLNIHPSLLPKYRGPSPIISAIIHGDSKMGVTIMKLDEGMDTGPLLLQKKVTIGHDEMHPDIKNKLAHLGIDALLEAIPPYIAGSLKPAQQEEGHATYTKLLSRDDGKIDWNKSAQEIYNLYRGLTPWPGIWTMWNNQRLKLLRVSKTNESIQAGKVVLKDGTLYIGCGKGALEVFELQLEGKKTMTTTAFLNGYKDIDGTTLPSS